MGGTVAGRLIWDSKKVCSSSSTMRWTPVGPRPHLRGARRCDVCLDGWYAQLRREGTLVDRAPGGNPVHPALQWEIGLSSRAGGVHASMPPSPSAATLSGSATRSPPDAESSDGFTCAASTSRSDRQGRPSASITATSLTSRARGREASGAADARRTRIEHGGRPTGRPVPRAPARLTSPRRCRPSRRSRSVTVLRPRRETLISV